MCGLCNLQKYRHVSALYHRSYGVKLSLSSKSSLMILSVTVHIVLSRNNVKG